MLSKSMNEGFARVAVAAFISHIDITVEELSDIKTAVSEAVTNSIVHGYKNQAGFITLECRLFSGNIVEITVADRGCGISDIHTARQPLFTTQPEQERSGMGFTVMETFMDEVIVESAVGQGTRVVMRKKLKLS
jgi:stage II sporulation protein AB (anti-sigma F factor)